MDAKLPPDLEHLIQDSVREFGGIIRRIAQMSVKFGADTTRDALNKALSDIVSGQNAVIQAELNLEHSKAAARRANVIPPGEYGAVAQAVRVALSHFRAEASGVTVPDMQRHMRSFGLIDITEQQIRNTLKGMIRAGYAINPSRGRYAAGPKLLKTSKEAA